jgi:hypothetical protein
MDKKLNNQMCSLTSKLKDGLVIEAAWAVVGPSIVQHETATRMRNPQEILLAIFLRPLYSDVSILLPRSIFICF